MRLTFQQMQHLPREQREVLLAMRDRDEITPGWFHARLGWTRQSFLTVVAHMTTLGYLERDALNDTLRVNTRAVISARYDVTLTRQQGALS
ncbi:MarR family transcriptional regulator [Deinococcus yavapaiensis]|uniref:Uncharacterized protein n=1 Tax=Deinococcus yavapaiensis KR-236 TaxID=694435 RepID=A0A318SE50_9DEIO|nr:helix-turn-helix domain-containing protein [Deinococcus yavapaiensis]PYE51038.1 hypothetical protein DES52_116105 [Deinococcus yavapaiensis KR-236]